MKNYKIQTLDENGALLKGPNLTSVIKNCSYSGKKFNKAVAAHVEKLKTELGERAEMVTLFFERLV